MFNTSLRTTRLHVCLQHTLVAKVGCLQKHPSNKKGEDGMPPQPLCHIHL